MGYSLSLLALQCPDPDEALSALGMERTGRKVEFESQPLTGYVLSGGWYLIVADRCGHRFLEQTVLKRISERYRVIAWALEEHVMFSSAEEWLAGKQVWHAEHQGENGPINLETSGTLPPSFQAMEAGFRAQQEAEGGADADVDYFFEIPLKAAKTIVGFKHDEANADVNYEAFDLLKETGLKDAALNDTGSKGTGKDAASQPSKPWWQFWK